jgi:RNA polymerase sigma-70 factor, ECF subfamily
LPANQRAALLLFEVLDFSVAEIAGTMDTTAASVNSALQRARRTVASKIPALSQQQTLRQIGDARQQEIVAGYCAALEQGDTAGLVALLTKDVTWSMPPLPHWYYGIDAVTDFAVQVPLTGCGNWRHLPTNANGQLAVASYLRKNKAGVHLSWSINVLTVRDNQIAEITSFIGPDHFAPFGLPAALP